MPYTERELPKRAKVLKLSDEPKDTKSSVASEEPSFVSPWTAKVDPKRTNDLKLSAEPRFA
jgi:hypothetical protein